MLNHHFNFCGSKSFYYSTEDALLGKVLQIFQIVVVFISSIS